MSNDPTTRMARRRRFILDRTAELEAELEALRAEANELDVAERVLKRFSEPPAIGGARVRGPAPDAEDGDQEEEPEGLTLPQMVTTILEEARAEGLKGVEGAELARAIRARWKPDFTSENVRPTLWRLVKAQRLRKRGKLYSLPSSPEGETGALGAPARH